MNNSSLPTNEAQTTSAPDLDTAKIKTRDRTSADRLLLVCFALAVISLIAVRFMSDKLGGHLGIAIIQIIIFLIPSYFYVKITGRRSSPRQLRERLSLRGISPRHIFLIISAALLCICLSLVFDMLFGGIKDTADGFSLYGIFSASGDGGEMAPLYLTVVYAILPALCEELLFRGVIFSEYKKYGLLCASLTSALFFALISFEFSLFPSAFLVGIIMACLLFITESVFVCATVHMLYNLFGIFMRTNISNYYLYSNNNTLLVLGIVFVILFSAAIFCFESARCFKDLAKKGKELPEGILGGTKQALTRTAKNLLSPCSLICIAIYAALCILGLIGII